MPAFDAAALEQLQLRPAPREPVYLRAELAIAGSAALELFDRLSAAARDSSLLPLSQGAGAASDARHRSGRVALDHAAVPEVVGRARRRRVGLGGPATCRLRSRAVRAVVARVQPDGDARRPPLRPRAQQRFSAALGRVSPRTTRVTCVRVSGRWGEGLSVCEGESM